MSVVAPSYNFIKTQKSLCKRHMLSISIVSKLVTPHTDAALCASYMIRSLSSVTAEPSYVIAHADAVDFV